MCRILLTAIAMLAIGCCGAETPTFIDALPHRTLLLPDYTTVEVYELNGSAYKRISVGMLEQSALGGDGVCFEAKFLALTPDAQLKISGSTVPLIPGALELIRKLKALKNGDNLSCFGTLRKAGDGKSVEFTLIEFFKEAGDLERFQALFMALKHRAEQVAKRDQQSLAADFMDLGKRASTAANQPTLTGNENFALSALASSAYAAGLDLKQSTIQDQRPNDAESWFSLAQEYRELQRSNVAKYRELVLKTLELDADHAGAGRSAEQLGYQKFEGRWRTPEQIAELVRRRDADQARLTELAAQRVRALRDRVTAEGPQLSSHLAAEMSSHNRTRAEAALAFYHEIVDEAPDVGGPLLASLADIDGPETLSALSFASQSPSPTLRSLGYEALAWRSNHAEEREAALKLLCDALKSEHASDAARSGVEALVALGTKPAIGALVCSLSTNDAAVRDAIILGLKAATHQPLGSREAWNEWWAKNRKN